MSVAGVDVDVWTKAAERFQANARVAEYVETDYPDRLVDFATDVLGADLWPKQRVILDAVQDEPYVAIKSAHDVGKTFTMACAIVGWLHINQPSVALSTAPSGRQVQHLLWREVNRLVRQARVPLLGRPLQTRYEIAPNWYGLGFASTPGAGNAAEDQASVFQGFHAENILLVCDEAAGIPEAVYQAFEGVLTSAGAHQVLIGNPTSVGGQFRRAFHEERHLWTGITITAWETPNFAEGRNVRPYLLTPESAARTIAKHGRDSDHVRSRLDAEFPRGGVDTLLPLAWFEAVDRVRLPAPPEGARWTAALDVARTGDDENAVVVRYGPNVEHVGSWSGLDTMETTGRLLHELRRFEAFAPDRRAEHVVRVDVIGIGAGVVDRLRELGYNVVEFNSSAEPTDREEYRNLREEGWAQLRHMMDPNQPGGQHVAFPHGMPEDLVAQATGVKYGYKSGYSGVIVEPKEDTKKRLSKSPDIADALMMAFCRMPPPKTAAARSRGVRVESALAGGGYKRLPPGGGRRGRRSDG